MTYLQKASFQYWVVILGKQVLLLVQQFNQFFIVSPECCAQWSFTIQCSDSVK